MHGSSIKKGFDLLILQVVLLEMMSPYPIRPLPDDKYLSNPNRSRPRE
jgi:hypothetical protein